MAVNTHLCPSTIVERAVSNAKEKPRVRVAKNLYMLKALLLVNNEGFENLNL